ncbi:MAG: hypothetical protein Ct9H300mP1_18740 [Planctomycetaceae bacterium]|nr:MAG: hypothetical protein Ct9H300mP1_18740 [Planctomycetaceae bacterium]
MSSVYGGHAVMSQGGVSIVDTPVQEAAGQKDSPDLAYKDFIEWGEGANREWVRYYVDHSREQIYDWLIDLGVQFSGIDSAPGNTVDRFHQPAGRGIGLVTPVYRACLERPNVRFAWNTRADSLVVNNQRVTGVRTTDMRDDTEKTFEADAVVLATGGFQSNLDLVREFWPAEFDFPKKILAGSGRHSMGTGHDMVRKIGGALVKMDYQWNYYSGLPDPQNPGSNKGLNAANMWGILVNWQGKRFANDHGWAKDVMPALLRQEQVTCWAIFDETTKKEFSVSGSDWADAEKVERLVFQNPKLVQSADTLEELARKSGLPVKGLTNTVRRYNSLIEKGVDDDFGRFGPGKTKFNNEASVKDRDAAILCNPDVSADPQEHGGRGDRPRLSGGRQEATADPGTVRGGRVDRVGVDQRQGGTRGDVPGAVRGHWPRGGPVHSSGSRLEATDRFGRRAEMCRLSRCGRRHRRFPSGVLALRKGACQGARAETRLPPVPRRVVPVPRGRSPDQPTGADGGVHEVPHGTGVVGGEVNPGEGKA